MLARLVARPQTAAPSTRRAYSFFSSKSGGRYFNSAKPPNSKIVAPSGVNGKADGGEAVKATTEEGVQGSNGSDHNSATSPPSWEPMVAPHEQQHFHHVPVTLHDFNLHNFFSLHRPLLLISQPASTIFDAPSSEFDVGASVSKSEAPVRGVEGFDEVPEVSPEADADTSRSLARALVVNRLGSAVDWENTLQKLGLDVNEGREAENVALMEEHQAYMDSTKRKRRKKMKKHKLRKRRRLQRFDKARLGK